MIGRIFIKIEKFAWALLTLKINYKSTGLNLVWGPPRPQDNVGDQALLLGASEIFSGSVTTVELLGQLNFAIQERISFSNIRKRWFAVKRMRNIASFTIIGADLIDGHWSIFESFNRLYLAKLFASRNVPTCIVGFSWNENPKTEACEAIYDAYKNGVRLVTRDSISNQRLKQINIEAIDGADIAFCSPIQSWDENEAKFPDWDSSSRHAAVNVCFSIGNFEQQILIYSSICNLLLNSGFIVHLIPMDLKPTQSDLTLLNLLDLESRANIVMHTERLTPQDVYRILKHSSLSIGGRMHFAILSILAGCPPLSIGYQGKFEGLYRDLGIPWLLANSLEQLLLKSNQLIDQNKTYRKYLQENRTRILKKAREGFYELERLFEARVD